MRKRKVLAFLFGIISIVLIYYGLKFAIYYRKVRRLIFLASYKLKNEVRGKYFTLTHINNVPIIVLSGHPKYYMQKYAQYFGDVIKIYPLLLPYFFPSPKKFDEFKNIAKQNAKFIPRFYLRELRYLSKYSGIKFEDLIYIHTFSDYFNYPGSFLCSAFVVSKQKSKINKIIIGRNLDYFVPFLKDLTVIHLFKNRGKKYFSIGFLGVLGIYSGMNEQGIVISNLLALNPKEKPKPIGIPSSFLYRKILHTQSTFLDAVKMIKNTYKPFSNNILISDANNSMVIEAFGDKMRIRKFNRGYVYTTNYILSKDIRGKKHIGKRYRFMNNVAKTKKKLAVDDIKQILDGVAIKYMTQHSIIFIPEDKKVYFAYGKIPSTREQYVELDNLFRLFNE
ncbi:MAG: C45 family autoproteolytic acyltransferase/hydrolase [Planctomycetota bacterium]